MSETAPVTVGAADVPGRLFWSVAGPTAVGWIVTYVLAIRQAVLDGRVGIPAYLVAVNFAWEFSLTFLLEQTPTQRQINFFWVLFNVVLLYQAFRYGRHDCPGLSPRAFRWTVVGVLIWAALIVMVVANEFHDRDGMYTGMIIQVPLSASFLLMLKRRGSSLGQSMHIAVAKFVGSLFAGLTAFLVYPSHLLFLVLVPTYVGLDIAYLVMLHGTMRAEGRPSWALRTPTTVAGPLTGFSPGPTSSPSAGVRPMSDDAPA
ncbi:transmembrane-type terpene cyclase [Streptomyces sp. 7N604]|uniref:transmembrane-type terpene cyclase n=1 Tax=Streptomyces sp. 7N604 TaxID=3457415 RepID=UPI003FD3D304